MTTYIYNMGLRFKAIAREYPNNVALSFASGESVDYHELDKKSDQIATLLLQSGAKPGKVVAIFADKHPTTYATMIACLKLGSPYVVLDTGSPTARLDKILKQCAPALIVSEEAGFSWNGAPVCPFEALEKQAAPLSATHIADVSGSTPAYLMFTSGSTGFPKGVTISHASMLNFCHWAHDTFSISRADILSGANPLYFDNSAFDFTASLFNGAALRPIKRDVLRQAKQLVEHTRACSLWFSVPSLLIYLATMKALTRESWPNMRAIIFGGEGFAKAELKKLYAMYGAQATLWNVYGPTECTCICSAYAISDADFTDMAKLAPLGLLAPNFDGLVMGDDGKPLTDGEIGELYLCGSQVALGYYNDVERTRASFVGNPLLTAVPQACYKTGDLVYRDGKTGFYHFAGRKDNQIKHMGYRIELEEIESALNGLDDVAQAAVIYIKHTSHGGRIVAFIKAAKEVSADQIKTHLRELLPSYMIPEELHLLNELPKNANGKVDRSALTESYGKQHA